MVNNFNYSKLKQRLFGNNSSLLINLFQKSFQKIEKIGNHQLNFDGVWKCDYKILNQEFFESLSIKLDAYGSEVDDTFLILPFDRYAQEWEEFSNFILSHEKIKSTLNSFFGNRDWKMGLPSVWRLRPMKIRPSSTNRADGARYWHTDDIRDDYLKLFINLMDIDDHHGPFSAISAKDSKNIIKLNKGANRFELEDQDLGVEVSKAIGPVGTSTFCTTSRCLHRGGFQSPNYHRDMMQLHFVLKKPFFGII